MQFLKSIDEDAVNKLKFTNFFAFLEIKVELVGSLISLTAPSVTPVDDSLGLEIFFPKTACIATKRPLPLAFCIPVDTIVTESDELANRFDLVVDGSVTDLDFKLRPKTPRAWKGETICSEEKTFLRQMQIERNNKVFTKVECTTKNYFTTNPVCIVAFNMQWPSSATEWLTRTRPGDTVTKENVQNIYRCGCHALPLSDVPGLDEAVCVHNFQDSQKDISWTISFAVAEKEFCQYLTQRQRRCFLLFRCLLDANVAVYEVPYLVALHIFFYACENIRRALWKENPVYCILVLLKSIYRAYKNQMSPHYFQAKKNLLKDMPEKEVNTVTEQLKNMLSNPLLAFFKALDTCNIVSGDLKHMFEDVLFETFKCVVNGKPPHGTVKETISPIVGRFVRDSIACRKYEKADQALRIFFSTVNTDQVKDKDKYALLEILERDTPTLLRPLSTHIKWVFGVFMDFTHGMSLTIRMFEDIPCIHISEVFGPEST